MHADKAAEPRRGG